MMQVNLKPALEALTSDQFEWAMAIVTGRYPGLPTGPGDTLEFDITALDSLTIRQLMDFCKTCAAANKVSREALL